MSRLVRSALLLLPFFAPGPVSAQIAPRPDYEDVGPANPFIGDSRMGEPGFGRQIGDLRSGIESARKNGHVSRGEARRLNREARAIARLASRYGQDGLSPGEQSELTTRTQVLRDAVSRAQSGTGTPKSGR